MIHWLYRILTGCWLRAQAILIVLMETGNHRDRNKIICCSRCEDTRGNAMHAIAHCWVALPPATSSPPFSPLWRPGRDVICGCYAAKWRWHSLHPLLLQHYPCGLLRKMQHSSSAPFPAWSLTPNSNQPSAFISVIWKWNHLSAMLIIISA